MLVDGRARPKRHAVSAGERVAGRRAAGRARGGRARRRTFAIAYEDEHLLVVDKPAGVVVHPGAGHRAGTLVQALAGRVAGGDDPERPGVVHRLDRDTSGLLAARALGRGPRGAAGRAARRARSRASTSRSSRAARGARRGTIDAPLGRDRRVRTRMSTDTDDPRDAVTHFEVERNLPAATLLRVRLETGRTHQIRAHLKAIGHPVLGDPSTACPALGLARQFLHAARLAFAHPVHGSAIAVESPLPEDLAAALASGLRRALTRDRAAREDRPTGQEGEPAHRR